MDPAFLLIQVLNGVQYGLLLFLIASGLTLIFGIMGVINLAHGALYMVGAYLAFWFTSRTGSFWLAILLALPLTVLLGLVIERWFMRALYKRNHLDQVLLTFGLILVLNECQSILFGNDVHGVPVPAPFSGSIPLTDVLSYPVYRLFVSFVCALIAVGMYFLIQHTRLGMVIRGGASNREMMAGMGINVHTVFGLVFAAGTALAAFAGMISAPLSSVYPGIGDSVLIISFVVVVIGGIGSIKGAFLGALMVGLTATFGTVFLPELSGAVVYALMAAVLLWRPRGLFA